MRLPLHVSAKLASLLLASALIAAPAPSPGAIDWLRVDIAQLQRAMEAGELSAEAVTRAHLERIAELDGRINAVIATDPTALAQARTLDAERAEGNVRGPLHGIPILLKDNIESRDQPTTAGSLALRDNHTGRDAFLVKRLRAAGAVILGKANLSEWANFRSERSSSGWSAVGGQTRNPYDPTRNPCGSSSGSGAAVAAGFSVAAIGTETNGSIVCPASANGNAAIKPTVGLISRTGIVPISGNQDTAGPMARSVVDAVLVLAGIMGADPDDAATSDRPEWSGEDLVAHLREDGLAGRRIGVLRSSSGFHPEADELLEQAIKTLESGGAAVIDELVFDAPEGFFGDTYKVLQYEFRHDLNRYLAGLPEPELANLTLSGLIDFNDRHADEQMPYFGQEIFIKSEARGPLSEKDYLDALARIRKAAREDGIDRLLAEHELDALIAPTGGPAWKIDLINGDHFSGGSSTLAAVSGYPNITVPMGLVHGMPVGLSIFGARFSEPVLIEIANGFEQATGRLPPPSFEAREIP